MVVFDQFKGGMLMFTGKKVSNFTERFSQLVEESGKSLVQLSKEIHMSNQALSTWRTGQRTPKEPTIIALANHFNVNVGWLMGFDVVKKANRYIIISDSDLFRKILMGMTPEDYETVMKIFEKTEISMKERGEF